MSITHLDSDDDRSLGDDQEAADDNSASNRTSIRGESTAADETTEPPPSPSTDDVFSVLSNHRRRHTIRYLTRNGDGPVQIRDLAAHVAACENDVAVQEVTYKERKRVYTSLHQLHLGKMDDLGIVRYDRDRGVVEPTDETDRYEAHLTAVTDDGTRWSEVSLAAAVSCVAAVAAAWTGIVPFVSGAGFAVALLVASVFSIVSAAHFVDARRRQ